MNVTMVSISRDLLSSTGILLKSCRNLRLSIPESEAFSGTVVNARFEDQIFIYKLLKCQPMITPPYRKV